MNVILVAPLDTLLTHTELPGNENVLVKLFLVLFCLVLLKFMFCLDIGEIKTS